MKTPHDRRSSPIQIGLGIGLALLVPTLPYQIIVARQTEPASWVGEVALSTHAIATLLAAGAAVAAATFTRRQATETAITRRTSLLDSAFGDIEQATVQVRSIVTDLADRANLLVYAIGSGHDEFIHSASNDLRSSESGVRDALKALEALAMRPSLAETPPLATSIMRARVRLMAVEFELALLGSRTPTLKNVEQVMTIRDRAADANEVLREVAVAIGQARYGLVD